MRSSTDTIAIIRFVVLVRLHDSLENQHLLSGIEIKKTTHFFFVFAVEHNETSIMLHAGKYGVRRNQFYFSDLINKYVTGTIKTSHHTI